VSIVTCELGERFDTHLIKARLYCRQEICVRLALSYNKNTVAFSDLEQYSYFVSVSIQSFRNQIAIE